MADENTLAEALRTIADHPVISESEYPEENCDWHCTAEMVKVAGDALAAFASICDTSPDAPADTQTPHNAISRDDALREALEDVSEFLDTVTEWTGSSGEELAEAQDTIDRALAVSSSAVPAEDAPAGSEGETAT